VGGFEKVNIRKQQKNPSNSFFSKLVSLLKNAKEGYAVKPMYFFLTLQKSDEKENKTSQSSFKNKGRKTKVDRYRLKCHHCSFSRLLPRSILISSLFSFFSIIDPDVLSFIRDKEEKVSSTDSICGLIAAGDKISELVKELKRVQEKGEETTYCALLLKFLGDSSFMVDKGRRSNDGFHACCFYNSAISSSDSLNFHRQLEIKLEEIEKEKLEELRTFGEKRIGKKSFTMLLLTCRFLSRWRGRVYDLSEKKVFA